MATLINYKILGKTDRALHTHIVPRYADEPDEQRPRPISLSDMSSAPKFDPARDKDLMQKPADSIQKRLHNSMES